MPDVFKHDIIYRKGKQPSVSRVNFSSSTISAFAKVVKDFIHFKVYPGFKGMIYASYNKGLQTIIQRSETAKDGVIDYGLPIFNYDIQLDGITPEGNSYWRNSSLMVNPARALYKPFYQDKDIEMRIVYRRMKGNIPMNIYCSSQPEEFDIQMAFTDALQSGNRWIVLPVRSYTIIPSEFLFTSIDGKTMTKSITEGEIIQDFIKPINRREYFVYTNSAPLVRLTSLTPSNSLYGGTSLPEFLLTGSLEFEIEIPQYVMTHSVSWKVDLQFNMGFDYYDEEKYLNRVFGNIRPKECYGDVIVCDNGKVFGQNNIIIDEDDVSELSFDVIYPNPRSFVPTDKNLKYFVSTPNGILDENAFEVVCENGIFKIRFLDKSSGNPIFFQKNDILKIYVFEPNRKEDFKNVKE